MFFEVHTRMAFYSSSSYENLRIDLCVLFICSNANGYSTNVFSSRCCQDDAWRKVYNAKYRMARLQQAEERLYNFVGCEFTPLGPTWFSFARFNQMSLAHRVYFSRMWLVHKGAPISQSRHLTSPRFFEVKSHPTKGGRFTCLTKAALGKCGARITPVKTHVNCTCLCIP